MAEVTTWYRTQPEWRGQRIVPVQVERYTEHSVYLVGEKRRHMRMGQFECFFPTWGSAHCHILAIAEREVDSAKSSLTRANEDLEKIQNLTEHDSASGDST